MVRVGLLRNRSAADRNAPWLHGLRHLADQFDLQKAIAQRGTLHLDILSEVEAPLEGPRCDSAVQKVPGAVGLVHTTGHDQRVLIDSDRDLVGLEAGHGQGDAIGVLACPVNVEGRVIVLRLEPVALVDQVEETVEADAGAPEGIEVQGSHGHILH